MEGSIPYGEAPVCLASSMSMASIPYGEAPVCLTSPMSMASIPYGEASRILPPVLRNRGFGESPRSSAVFQWFRSSILKVEPTSTPSPGSFFTLLLAVDAQVAISSASSALASSSRLRISASIILGGVSADHFPDTTLPRELAGYRAQVHTLANLDKRSFDVLLPQKNFVEHTCSGIPVTNRDLWMSSPIPLHQSSSKLIAVGSDIFLLYLCMEQRLCEGEEWRWPCKRPDSSPLKILLPNLGPQCSRVPDMVQSALAPSWSLERCWFTEMFWPPPLPSVKAGQGQEARLRRAGPGPKEQGSCVYARLQLQSTRVVQPLEVKV
ncbi:hypothetical protein U0070_011638 [Myodes glareolus]|uniref:Uncharacterized protein n=1 Tax=Myodes glareolus TaxID=447135 RepID=A0AAW0HKP3_MYOGA